MLGRMLRMFRNLTNYSSHQGENLTAIYIGSINLTPSFRILSSLSWCHTTLIFFKFWSLKMKVTNRAFSHNSLNWPDHGMCVFVGIGDDRYTSISIKVLMMNKYRCSKSIFKFVLMIVTHMCFHIFSYWCFHSCHTCIDIWNIVEQNVGGET